MNQNQRLRLLCLGLLLVAAAGKPAARAQDELHVPARPSAAALNWSGFYFGGNVGGIWGNYGFGDSIVDVSIPQIGGGRTVVPLNVPAFSANSGGDFIGGVQAGYNRQFGSFLLGLEGDAVGTPLEASKTFTLHSDLLPDDVEVSRTASSDWLITGRVRAGYAWNRFLFYATGGLAVTDVIVEAENFFVSGASTRSTSDDTVVAGWTVGGGAEFALSDAVSAGVEYRHSDFGGHDYDLTGISRFNVHSTHVDLTTDQVMLRVNIRVDSLFHR